MLRYEHRQRANSSMTLSIGKNTPQSADRSWKKDPEHPPTPPGTLLCSRCPLQPRHSQAFPSSMGRPALLSVALPQPLLTGDNLTPGADPACRHLLSPPAVAGGGTSFPLPPQPSPQRFSRRPRASAPACGAEAPPLLPAHRERGVRRGGARQRAGNGGLS